MSTWLIIGLGNPGTKYANNRHNIGYMVVDELASQLGSTFSKHKSNASVAEGRVVMGGDKLILAKSNTFMNLSGGPVSSLAKYFDVSPEHIIVVHDELDLPFDSLKLKVGGGHGGHNGLRDIAKALDTQNFVRLRLGIGRPPGRQDPADFVLGDFSSTEKKTLPIFIADACEAVKAAVTDGITAAQQKFHSERGSGA